MADYTIERRGDVALGFSGELLADTTSANGQPRWSEVRIFRTDSGKYVIEVVGMSAIEDEIALRTVSVVTTPLEVRDVLKRGNTYLTDVALDALETAADFDEALREALVERI